MSQILDRVLTAARQLGASDVHLKAGLPPIFRIKGDLRTVRDVPALTREAIAQFAVHMMNDRQRADFEQNLDIDLAYGTPDGVRYRVNMFQQRGSVGMVLRLIPPEVPPFDRLNLPKTVLELADGSRGIILVTGATGSGKSTTLAAMIDYINTQHAYHIVTVEDPIEYTFRDKRSVLNQREIGVDTNSFATALRAALRQDPDVILVGEMRDFETAEIAMTAAETGHLVFATLHTKTPAQGIDRIVDVFPPHQQQQARVLLANVLHAVLTQQLIPRKDGEGIALAMEMLMVNPAIRNLIREGKTFQIQSLLQTGSSSGMLTMENSLKGLVEKGWISAEDAIEHCFDPKEMARLLGRR